MSEKWCEALSPGIETWFSGNHQKQWFWRFQSNFWRNCHQKVKNLSHWMCFYCVEAPGEWCDAVLSWTKGELPRMRTRLFKRRNGAKHSPLGSKRDFWGITENTHFGDFSQSSEGLSLENPKSVTLDVFLVCWSCGWVMWRRTFMNQRWVT